MTQRKDGARSPRRGAPAPCVRPAARQRRTGPGTVWSIELHTERLGWLSYAYRRLRLERSGDRATAREVTVRLAYDEDDLALVTRPRDLVRVRGRALDLDEAEALWRTVRALRPETLRDRYPCLDHLDPRELDPAVGIDGVPIAVSSGEEGPMCLTLRWGQDERARQRRVLVDRYREPAAEWTGVDRGPRLTRLVAHVDAGLEARAPLTARRIDPATALAAEFEALRGLAFLNLRQAERRFVEALGSAGGGRAVFSLTGALFADDARVRVQALEALGAIGARSAVAEVELLAYDDETPVREAARRVLDALRPEPT